MAVDIDEVLEAIGEVGPYQRRVYLLLCLPIIFVGASNLAYVFISAAPLYRCLIPYCDDDTHPVYHESFLNYTIPWDKTLEEYESCLQYRRKTDANHSRSCTEDDFTETTESCKFGVVIDKSVYGSTIITEFNLTCSDRWEASADQSIFFAGILVGSFFFGIISDVFGRRKTILAGIVMMSVSGITIALVPNLISFHVMRFLNAMSSSGVFQTAFVLGLEFVGPRYRVMFGIIGEYFFAMGEIFLGFVAWGIRSWRMIQLVISAPVVCFIFYYWVVPESVRWLQAKGRHARVVASLESIAKINKRTIPLNLLRHQAVDDDNSDDFSVLINRHHKVTILDILKSPVMTFRTFLMIIIWITTTLTYYGLSYNATDLGAGNSSNKPYVNFIFSSLVEIPGYTLAWIGMEYWGRKGALVSSLMLSGTACIALGYLDGYLSTLLMFLVGKCNITCAFAVIYVFTAEMFPTSVRNTIIGTCSMFARIGGMLAPFSSDLRSIYLALPMLIFGSCSILSGVLALAVPETLNTKLPETISEAVHLGKRSNIVIPVYDTREDDSRISSEETERLLSDTKVDDEEEP